MCGMTSAVDIAKAVSLGVDAIGLVFYPASRRAVTMDQAKRLLSQPPVFVDVVAVMVNPSVTEVQRIIHELPVQWLQFHGEETPEFCAQFNRPYIKAIAVTGEQQVNNAIDTYSGAAALLLDTESPQRGGTGKVFDWKLIPANRKKPLILAGGLNNANVKAAVTRVKPYAVDVCSGIEKTAGVKDHEKMIRFVNALRGENHE